MPAGLVGLEARVREDLANERREIDEMDMVDSIHEAGGEPAISRRLSGRWKTAGATSSRRSWGTRVRGAEDCASPITGWAPGSNSWSSAGKTRSAAGAAIFAWAGAALGPAVMRGGFNRTSALRIPNTRLFRTGNPFIDMLENTIVIDDRASFGVPSERPACAANRRCISAWTSWSRPTSRPP